MIKSNAETSRSYIVQTLQGEERRNRIHLRETAITTKIELRAPNGEKVKSGSPAPKQSPVVQSVPKPVVQSVAKPIVQSVPKPIVQVVPKPNVESVPKLSVSSTMCSAGSASAQNQSANNAPKVVLRKVQGSIQMDNTSVPGSFPSEW